MVLNVSCFLTRYGLQPEMRIRLTAGAALGSSQDISGTDGVPATMKSRWHDELVRQMLQAGDGGQGAVERKECAVRTDSITGTFNSIAQL